MVEAAERRAASEAAEPAGTAQGVRRRPGSGGLHVVVASGRRLALLVGGFVFVAPLVILGVGAVAERWFFPAVLPGSIDAGGARRLIAADRTVDALLAGLSVSGTVTVAAVLLAWPAARALADRELRGRGLVLALLFLPSLLPAVGLAMGIDVALLRVGLAGHFSGVVLAHLVPCIPYGTAVLSAVFLRHDPRSEDQAAVLGASPWQRFRLVTFPQVRSGVAVAAVLVFLVSWSQYLLTLLVGSGRVVTLTVLLFAALAGGNPNTIGTLAILTALPCIMLLALVGGGVDEGEPS